MRRACYTRIRQHVSDENNGPIFDILRHIDILTQQMSDKVDIATTVIFYSNASLKLDLNYDY